jgi:hypothetical protein
VSLACQKARTAHMPPPGDDAALQALAQELARPAQPARVSSEAAVTQTTFVTSARDPSQVISLPSLPTEMLGTTIGSAETRLPAVRNVHTGKCTIALREYKTVFAVGLEVLTNHLGEYWDGGDWFASRSYYYLETGNTSIGRTRMPSPFDIHAPNEGIKLGFMPSLDTSSLVLPQLPSSMIR